MGSVVTVSRARNSGLMFMIWFSRACDHSVQLHLAYILIRHDLAASLAFMACRSAAVNALFGAAGAPLQASHTGVSQSVRGFSPRSPRLDWPGGHWEQFRKKKKKKKKKK